MVNSSSAEKLDYSQDVKYSTPPEEEIKWCTVSLADIVNAGKRLEASVFDADARAAIDLIRNNKFGSVPLFSSNKQDEVANVYHAGRFKRNYIDQSQNNAVGFLGSSEMLDAHPVASKFLTREFAESKGLFVDFGTILVSCSGTIGNVTLANHTLTQYAFSQHIIRLECKDYPGYIYACLKSKACQAQIKALIYGAVIQELEPHHLKNIIIPNPPTTIKQHINRLIMHSYELRDQSNELIDKARDMFVEALKLPPIYELHAKQFSDNFDVNNYNVKLSELSGRLDGSYHVPLVDSIVEHLEKHAAEVITVGDSRITSQIILAGVFKRVYVEEAYGIPFLGGKEITQLAPKTEKFLSRPHHLARYKKELRVSENMILVTNRGSIGTAALVPKHWEGWAVSQNVLKVVPASDSIAGYLFIFLNSEWGKFLIQRQTYGSVVDMIDNRKMAAVELPLLKSVEIQAEINRLALEANKLRHQAYQLEQEAMQIMDDEVIFA